MKIYFAGPLFSEAERDWIRSTIKQMESIAAQVGVYRVLFFMSSRPDELEESRLKKVFEISGEVLKRGKGKILGCCYSQFLENGKIWNHRSEELSS